MPLSPLLLSSIWLIKSSLFIIKSFQWLHWVAQDIPGFFQPLQLTVSLNTSVHFNAIRWKWWLFDAKFLHRVALAERDEGGWDACQFVCLITWFFNAAHFKMGGKQICFSYWRWLRQPFRLHFPPPGYGKKIVFLCCLTHRNFLQPQI